jgi:hypothetical protein
LRNIGLISASTAKNLGNKTPQGVDANASSANVSSISIKDSPKVQHKNLNVIEEFERANLKNSASFVVIGELLAHYPLCAPLTLFEAMSTMEKALLWGDCCTISRSSTIGPWKS